MLFVGDKRKQYEAQREHGHKTPLDYEPEMYADLSWVWDAFHALSGSRQMGYGAVGPVPFEAIDRYAVRYNVEDFEYFHALIAAMDGAYLKHVNKTNDPTKGGA